MKHVLSPISRALAGLSLVGAVGLASAQTLISPTAPTTTTATTKPATASTPTNRLVSSFTPLAGSEQNASALVKGLRTGSPITLTDSTVPPPAGGTTPPPGGTTFTSPTKPMGYGNIRIALSLAEAKLASQGITKPTPAQLQGALMGTTTGTGPNATTTQGILQMRASGMGWGQIANAQGFKLGPVMSGKQTFAATTTTGTTTNAAASPVTAHGKSGVTTAAGSSGKGVTTAAGSSGKGGVATAGGGNAGSHGKSQVVTAGGSGGGGVANAFGHANNAGGASAGVVSAAGAHAGGNGGGNSGGASQGKGGGKP